MRYAFVLLAASSLTAFAVAGSVATAVSAPNAASGGWETLFDGKTLDGWVPRDRADVKFRVEDGLLVAGPESPRGYLVTTKEFDDFELTVEFWVNEGANSGVFLRVPKPDVPLDQKTGVEVNISDTHATWPTGSINEIAKVAVAPVSINKWNMYEITANGPHIVVKLNGTTSVDALDPRHARGPVGVQYCCRSGNVVKFRNIHIRSIAK
jgi:hypothetical protein